MLYNNIISNWFSCLLKYNQRGRIIWSNASPYKCTNDFLNAKTKYTRSTPYRIHEVVIDITLNLKRTAFFTFCQQERCVWHLIPHSDIAWWIVELWLRLFFDLCYNHCRIFFFNLSFVQILTWVCHKAEYSYHFDSFLQNTFCSNQEI